MTKRSDLIHSTEEEIPPPASSISTHPQPITQEVYHQATTPDTNVIYPDAFHKTRPSFYPPLQLESLNPITVFSQYRENFVLQLPEYLKTLIIITERDTKIKNDPEFNDFEYALYLIKKANNTQKSNPKQIYIDFDENQQAWQNWLKIFHKITYWEHKLAEVSFEEQAQNKMSESTILAKKHLASLRSKSLSNITSQINPNNILAFQAFVRENEDIK